MSTPSPVFQRPDSPKATAADGRRTFAQWLDALADGACTREALVRGVTDEIDANPDSGWELLSLVDQYYRRRRIDVEDFRNLNVRVQSLLMGGVQTAEVRPSTPAQPQPSRAKPATAPTPSAMPPAARAAAPVVLVAANATAPKRSVAINDLLRNRYRVRAVLGRGGMGTVYAAVDLFRLERTPGDQNVALKVLHTDLIKRPGLLAELRSEFQCLQALSHPNIVRVHDFDQDGELTFFTMEQLSGAPLSRLLAEQQSVALHRPYALAIIRQVGAAVVYAHSRGIVHGDLNPGNIFVTDVGEIRVLDFGASARQSPSPSLAEVDGDSRATVATPSYASCEVLEGHPPTAADDVYAMACIIYVLLTGEHPFNFRNALAARNANQEPHRPAGISFSRWRTLKAGLSFDRKRHPADLQAWLERLDLPPGPSQLPALVTIAGERPTPPRVSPWISVALIALVAGIVWWAQDRYNLLGGLLGNSSTIDVSSTWVSPAPPVEAPAVVEPQSTPVAPVTPPPVARQVPVPPPLDVAAPEVDQPAKSQSSPATVSASAASAGVLPSDARIELASSTLDLSPDQAVASIPVHRRHNYRNAVSFTWSTEPGTANAGQDYIPVKSRTEYMSGGEPEVRLLIPIVADPRRHTSRTFYVVINGTGEGVSLGAKTMTMVTIPAGD